MRNLLFTIACVAWVTAVSAQSTPNFTIEASSDSVLLGNHLIVRFTLDQGEGEDFQPPAFEGFDIVSGPNVSSSFSSINGKVSQQISYVFYLNPHDIGNFFIEPASIRLGKQILETTPYEIVVLSNPDGIIQKDKPFKDALPFSWFDEMPIPRPRSAPAPEAPKPQSQKKRKTYKL